MYYIYVLFCHSFNLFTVVTFDAAHYHDCPTAAAAASTLSHGWVVPKYLLPQVRYYFDCLCLCMCVLKSSFKYVLGWTMHIWLLRIQRTICLLFCFSSCRTGSKTGEAQEAEDQTERGGSALCLSIFYIFVISHCLTIYVFMQVIENTPEFVMFNLFPHFLHHFSCPYTVSGEHEPNVILKDNDIKYKIRLPRNTTESLIGQIRSDVDFLFSIGVMDYSLLGECF